jgi:carbon-monoxide dehydrogenase small subunit
MTLVRLTVNGRTVEEAVEPRLHLADLLRERMNLTATHLRCEQGACGACTLLIDGAPARSCITFAVMCEGAEITTLEGLENDPLIVALRSAFSQEHGLQCGYCTPGMLMTARDIVLRLPDADAARVRKELSGNLCRCTGYVGIVRAIQRVLDERRSGQWSEFVPAQGPAGPVGSRPPRSTTRPSSAAPAARAYTVRVDVPAPAATGLGGRRPNLEIHRAFTIARTPDEVWAFFADLDHVVRCLPGARLSQPPAGDRIEGVMAVKLGPITARFAGAGQVTRDEAARRGTIMGAGMDQAGGSHATGELEYGVEPDGAGGTRVTMTVRALLSGPLAQFSRGGIVEDLVARMTQEFARNLEATLAGAAAPASEAPLQAGALLRTVLFGRIKAALRRLFGGWTRS